MKNKVQSLDRSAWLEQRKTIESKFLLKDGSISKGNLIDNHSSLLPLENTLNSTLEGGDRFRSFFRSQKEMHKSVSSFFDSTTDHRSVMVLPEKQHILPRGHKPSYFDMEAFRESSSKYKELIEEPLIYYPRRRANTSADVFKYLGKEPKGFLKGLQGNGAPATGGLVQMPAAGPLAEKLKQKGSNAKSLDIKSLDLNRLQSKTPKQLIGAN